jgi:hypothetical protein
MVITARLGAGSRFQKLIDQYIVDGIPTGDMMLGQIPVKKVQRCRFVPIFSIQCLLVSDKLREGFR